MRGRGDMAAEETIRILHEFAQEVAHGIRNPLGSIELMASLLLKGQRNETDRQRLSQIIEAVRLIDRRITEFMAASKLLGLSREEVDLNGLLKEILGAAGPTAGDSIPFLTVRYGEGGAVVRGNREMLKHLFINLIFNCLNSLPEGGRLGIETGVSGPGPSAHVTLKVSESPTGEGVFGPSPIEVFLSGSDRGAGLGFAVLHSIVAFHGGAFTFAAEPEGGVSMTVAFPPGDAPFFPGRRQFMEGVDHP